MPTMAAACSPSSLQLRLTMNCKNCKVSPAILIRSRARNRECHRRLLCVANKKSGVERRRNGSSWIASSSAADNFAGWSDSEDGDGSVESDWKKWVAGMVGAGLLGVVIFAGVNFAALSFSKRGASRLPKQMEPLTTQQETLLESGSEDDKREEYIESEGSKLQLNDDSLESNSSSPQELYERPGENKHSDSNEASSVDDVEYTMSSGDTLKNSSGQEDLPYAPENTISSKNLPNSEATSEIEKISVNVEQAELSNTTNFNFEHGEVFPGSKVILDSDPPFDSSVSNFDETGEHVAVSSSFSSQFDAVVDSQLAPEDETNNVANEELDLSRTSQVSTERSKSSPLEVDCIDEKGSPRTSPVPELAYSFSNEQDKASNSETHNSPTLGSNFSSAGIPAPSLVTETLQGLPGKVLVPAVVDQVHGQALAALQVLKVIEADVQPSDLCTRREYARWLVAATSVLSRNTMSKVYPAMYIEDVTELAFDDITPHDPDFSFIQGLAEAGLISSKLSRRDLLSSSDEHDGLFYFSPESPLSRQDLVSWKMALEKRQLPEPNEKILYQLSGFRDIDKINPHAWPALIADLSAGDQGIISLAFGCTRLFQPNKPVTKAQAAIALATGEASDIVSEELARIEAESMAENAVSAHNALVAEVERDVNASFEKELFVEREKINVVEKMAEEARRELERLRTEREQDNMILMKERAAVESEMEVLSRLRREVEEQLQNLMSNKVAITYEKERISKLQKEAETEKQEISRLQYELEVERKALSMARSWAEDEAKRAREQAKALEEARDRWERHGIKVVVDSDLQEESSAGVTWLTAGSQFSVKGTVNRAENLVDKLKLMANEVQGKSREIIEKIINKLLCVISVLKEWVSKAGVRATELKDAAVHKVSGSIQDLQQATAEHGLAIKEKTKGSIQAVQQSSSEFRSAVREGAKRVAGDCREGVEKLTQKFK